METPWIPAKSQIVYQAQSDENVAQPCIVRMLDGNLIILVQQKGNEPIFIRSTDGGRTWSQPYSGILPDGAGEISTLGVGHNGRLITVLGHA
ncbi:TPA: hypothetical protein DHW51_07015, partial [Candidatus Poribacteria bacterium]|nr:hypothetical protein [Candidatus Poribacteria bacterium]